MNNIAKIYRGYRNMEQYEEIKDNNKIITIIVRVDYSFEGINFFTSAESPQQLA
jgi:hypothetical protein